MRKGERKNLRGDLLLGDVKVGGGVTLVGALANTVDLVVGGSTMMVSVLTGTGDGPLDVGRMPGTNTGNLAETLVRLARKLLGSPTGGHTLETVTLGDGNAVDHLVLLEDGVDLDGLLEDAVSKVDLVDDGAAVDLDLHEMGLLLLERRLADLGVRKDTDDGAVLLHALELAGDGGALVLGVVLGVLGEGLLLGLVPVLVEAALDLVGQMLSPDGGERAEATGGLDVANQTDSDHLCIISNNPPHFFGRETYRRSLDNGNSLDNLLLVHLGTGAVQVTDDRSHTGLVAHGGGEVNRLLGVILGEAGGKQSEPYVPADAFKKYHWRYRSDS